MVLCAPCCYAQIGKLSKIARYFTTADIARIQRRVSQFSERLLNPCTIRRKQWICGLSLLTTKIDKVQRLLRTGRNGAHFTFNLFASVSQKYTNRMHALFGVHCYVYTGWLKKDAMKFVNLSKTLAKGQKYGILLALTSLLNIYDKNHTNTP